MTFYLRVPGLLLLAALFLISTPTPLVSSAPTMPSAAPMLISPVNGAVMGPGVDSAGVAGGPDVHYNPKPICAVLAGNLFNDDKILSVAHQFQIHTDWHTRHPSL